MYERDKPGASRDSVGTVKIGDVLIFPSGNTKGVSYYEAVDLERNNTGTTKLYLKDVELGIRCSVELIDGFGIRLRR